MGENSTGEHVYFVGINIDTAIKEKRRRCTGFCTKYGTPGGKFIGNDIAQHELHFELNPENQKRYSGFPLGLENLEKWERIFQSGKSQGILNRLEKSGKITQNTGKLREFEINII